MKYTNHNVFKYIFAIVVVGLIVGAVYIVYYQNNKVEENDDDESITNEIETEISLVENFKMGVSSFDTMNPLLTNNKEIVNIDRFIFEPLINITSDYHTELCLAKSCDKTSDTTYEIKVDSNIKWQDGSSLISKDIQYTVDVLKNVNSIYSSNVQYIQSVELPDSETAIITLSQPVQNFEYYLDFPLVSSSYYYNDDFVNSNKIPIGTGMYKIASNDNDNVFLIRNDRWRNIKNSTPKTQSITIHKYSAIGEMFNTFKLGNIDIINTYMTNYSEFVGTMGYNKKEYAGRDYSFISFNCNDNILSDKIVRQAINMAINKENIVSTVFSNSKIVANSPLDYGSYLYNSENLISYNPEQSKKILEENGWVYTNDKWQKTIDGYVRKLSITLVVNEEDSERMNVANNIQEQLKAIGINVNIAKVNSDRYYKYLNEKNYQMILTGVKNSITPDLNYFYGYGNLSNYNNETVNSKVSSLENYAEIQKIVNEDVPYIGLYRNKGIVILNANVGGNFTPTSYNVYYNFNEWFRQQ